MPIPAGDMNRVLAERPAGRADFGAQPSTLAGSALGAKLSASRWRRQQDDSTLPRKEEGFAMQRELDPGVKLWSDRFATTSAATEFMAPPPPPPSGPTSAEVA